MVGVEPPSLSDDADRTIAWSTEADPASGLGTVDPATRGEAPPPDSSTPGRQKMSKGWRTATEWGVLVVVAIVIAILIKTFLFQAFYIPSGSMVPTLEVGDRVLVNKVSYDLHDVHRGDIVVFEAGPNTRWRSTQIDDLVKRVIALPGETISSCAGTHVCIDGKELKEPYLPKGTPTLNLVTQTIPKGEYFVMGDNRTESQDARAHGPVKGSSIVGRVFVRIWPLDRIGFL